eukprot:7436599-Heterocapsa_arctica.AAC.1
MNNSHYDPVARTWNLSWKWGTFSCWTYSEDVHILLIRYAQLFLIGDLEMVMPNALFSMGATATDCPDTDRLNPWWYITRYIQMLVETGVIDDAGQAE